MQDRIQLAVEAPIAKAASAWAVVGTLTLVDLQHIAGIMASVFASVYTLCLLGEWFYKKFVSRCRSRRRDD